MTHDVSCSCTRRQGYYRASFWRAQQILAAGAQCQWKQAQRRQPQACMMLYCF